MSARGSRDARRLAGVDSRRGNRPACGSASSFCPRAPARRRAEARGFARGQRDLRRRLSGSGATAGGCPLEFRDPRPRPAAGDEVRQAASAALRRRDAGRRRGWPGLTGGRSSRLRSGCAARVAALLFLLADIAFSLRRGEFGLDLIAALAMAGALAARRTARRRRHCADVHRRRGARGFRAASRETRADGAPEPHAAHGGSLPRRDARGGAHRRLSAAATASSSGTARSFPPTAPSSTAPAILDESALTGEAMPVRLGAGQAVMSGSLNAGDPFDLRVSEPAPTRAPMPESSAW